MKSFLLTILTLVSVINSFAQIAFEEGYLISTTGKVTHCLIRNREWKNNPAKFEYKTNEAAQTLTASIDSVQEFAITNGPKYQRFTVQVDYSNSELDELSRSRNPEFKKETVFLKVLVEGKASLFSYESPKFYWFFYRVGNDSVRQLVYKKYLTQDKVGVNQLYKEQLWTDLKCEGIKRNNVSAVKYFLKPLTNFFNKYNACIDPGFEIKKTKKTDVINLSIRPGVNFSSASIANSVVSMYDTDFGRKPSVRLGLEVEFILPFNKTKWAVVLEPTYQSYNNTKDDVSIEYQSLELPLGLRYYIFLNDNSRFFVNGLGLFDFSSGSAFSFESREDLKIVSDIGAALGAGFNFKKYTLETRYYFNRDILSRYSYWDGKYNSISIIVGYKLF